MDFSDFVPLAEEAERAGLGVRNARRLAAERRIAVEMVAGRYVIRRGALDGPREDRRRKVKT